MAENKSHPLDLSNSGAYDTSYTPSPQSGPPDGGPPPPYNPDCSIQGQNKFSNGPANMTTTGVVVQNTVAANNMYREGGQMPPNYFVHNVLVMLCCCLIFGIIGLVKGSQVGSLYVSGNYAAANEASRGAKRWFQAGLCVGSILNIITLIVYMVVYFISFA